MNEKQYHEALSKESEEIETRIFFDMSKKIFHDISKDLSDLYDIAYKLTDGFQKITPSAILGDSRIIKILRYATIPVISQMKLGQILGMDSTTSFEESKISGGKTMTLLKINAAKLVKIFNDNLDRQRFLWLNTKLDKDSLSLAKDYAKKWTCSLIANQNSATDFRNWRKEMQESTITEMLLKSGYKEVSTRSIISKVSDIQLGHFSRECRVKGRSVQKTDFAIRLKGSKKLMLIEAKAIGVKIDAFKRIKECREKAEDWKSHFGSSVICGDVIAGFIPASQVVTLLDSDIKVYWEHKLDDLYDFVSKN